MRLVLLVIVVGCTTPSPPAPHPREGASSDEARQGDTPRTPKQKFLDGLPDQGPPGPPESPLPLAEVSWSGTTWSVEGGGELSFTEAGTTLGGQPVDASSLGPSGGPLGPHTLQALTPCAAVLWADGAYRTLVRTAPSCVVEEQGYDDPMRRFATFAHPSGERYVFMAGGEVWRHGPKRVFKRPRGALSQEGDAQRLTFGPTTFTMHAATPCDLALPSSSGMVPRFQRVHPPCAPQERSAVGLPWSLWALKDGSRIDLRGAAAAAIDPHWQQEAIEVTWAPTDGGFTLGEGGRYRQATVNGCAVSVASGEVAAVEGERLFPPCE